MNKNTKTSRIGEEKRNKWGQLMRIVDYKGKEKVFVLFPESGYKTTTQYARFKVGNIKDQSCRKVILLEGEEWRDVIGFEGLYKVSNHGRVISLRNGSERLMFPILTKAGYWRIAIHIRPFSGHYMVHRWVAEAFLPNPNNLPFINHKDENRANNNVDNLEWCTKQYNNTYGTALEKAHKTRKKNGYALDVYQYTIDGELVAYYSSIYKAWKATGIKMDRIGACMRGGRVNTANGYIFIGNQQELLGRIEKIKTQRNYKHLCELNKTA